MEEDENGKIFTINPTSIRQYYRILREVELLVVNLDDTPLSSKSGYLCINEFMLKLARLVDVGREWSIPTTWEVELEKPPTVMSPHKGSIEGKSLEGNTTLKRLALTLEEATKLKVHKRGQKKVTSKRSLTLIKKEAAPLVIEESIKMKRTFLDPVGLSIDLRFELSTGVAKATEEEKISKEIKKISMRSYQKEA
ncbi:hypothetical protein ACLOJK_001233 [Asimina triloba]